METHFIFNNSSKLYYSVFLHQLHSDIAWVFCLRFMSTLQTIWDEWESECYSTKFLHVVHIMNIHVLLFYSRKEQYEAPAVQSITDYKEKGINHGVSVYRTDEPLKMGGELMPTCQVSPRLHHENHSFPHLKLRFGVRKTWDNSLFFSISIL